MGLHSMYQLINYFLYPQVLRYFSPYFFISNFRWSYVYIYMVNCKLVSLIFSILFFNFCNGLRFHQDFTPQCRQGSTGVDNIIYEP